MGSLENTDSVFFTINASSSDQIDHFLADHSIQAEKNTNISGLIYSTCYSCHSGGLSSSKSLGKTREQFDFGVYHTLKEIQDWLKSLPENLLKTYGKSYENRALHVIDIGDEKDPAVVIECGIHAREWVSVAFCPFLINQILTKKWEKDGIRWVIFPMVNPDGYRFSWRFNRFWRKNRRIIRDSPCHGVDLNRNFDIEWV